MRLDMGEVRRYQIYRYAMDMYVTDKQLHTFPLFAAITYLRNGVLRPQNTIGGGGGGEGVLKKARFSCILRHSLMVIMNHPTLIFPRKFCE